MNIFIRDKLWNPWHFCYGPKTQKSVLGKIPLQCKITVVIRFEIPKANGAADFHGSQKGDHL
jgi:hypothetical protein